MRGFLRSRPPAAVIASGGFNLGDEAPILDLIPAALLTRPLVLRTCWAERKMGCGGQHNVLVTWVQPSALWMLLLISAVALSCSSTRRRWVTKSLPRRSWRYPNGCRCLARRA
jgi:hypothetical protein